MKETFEEETKRLYSDFSNRFSNYILGELIGITEEDKNIVISPSRLQVVLALLANWTTPKIRKEILEVIGGELLTIKEANVLCSVKNLILTSYKTSYMKKSAAPTLEFSTLFWVDKKLEVNVDGLDKLGDDYEMLLKCVDFTDPNLKSVMDKTIKSATHGLIKKLDIQLTPETIAILTDILYFKATWSEQFDSDYTREQIFNGTKGKKKVPMMKLTSNIEYRESDYCQMVKLPYMCITQDQKSFSMIIYLPKPKHDFIDVLHERWEDSYFLDMMDEEVKLTLPKFSVESSVDMKQLLTEIGLSCIYDSKNIIPACIKDIQIDKILQQAKVTVDEKGTEASAVTVVEMIDGCLPPFEQPEPVVMTVNRPFIFEIREDSTETILFTGVVNNIE